MLDEFGQYRSIARDVIVEVRLVTHLRNRTLRTMNYLHLRRGFTKTIKCHEQAERQADGGSDDSHLWVDLCQT